MPKCYLSRGQIGFNLGLHCQIDVNLNNSDRKKKYIDRFMYYFDNWPGYQVYISRAINGNKIGICGFLIDNEANKLSYLSDCPVAILLSEVI